MRRIESKNESTTAIEPIKNRLADRFHPSWHNEPPQVDFYCPAGHDLPQIFSDALQQRACYAVDSALSVAWIYWDLQKESATHHGLARYVDDVISKLSKSCHPALILHAKDDSSIATDDLLRSVKEHLSGTIPLLVIVGNKLSIHGSYRLDSSWKQNATEKALAATLCYPLLRELLAKICDIFPDHKEQAADINLFRQIFIDTFNDN